MPAYDSTNNNTLEPLHYKKNHGHCRTPHQPNHSETNNSNIFFNSVPVSRQEEVHYLGDHKKINTDLVGEK